MDQAAVLEATRRWIASFVIELNLCPFAQRVFQGEKIRYVVSSATEENELVQDLARELAALASMPLEEVETTLLIHPGVFEDFYDYNNFLDVAERQIKVLGLRGVIQIASFHPRYQFAGTSPDAAENYTNRAPFPMLHLLREASIDRIAAPPEELLDIPRRNIATLNELGKTAILAKLKAIGGPLGPNPIK